MSTNFKLTMAIRNKASSNGTGYIPMKISKSDTKIPDHLKYYKNFAVYNGQGDGLSGMLIGGQS